MSLKYNHVDMTSEISPTMTNRSLVETSIGVIRRPQTYRNLLYLVLAFPLGLLYFTVLTSGIALGIGLVITLVGIPLLLAVVVGSRYLVAFERWLADRLLDIDLSYREPLPRTEEEGLWPRIRAVLSARATWLGLVYLYARFALGLASFVLVTVSLALAFTLVTAPLHYTDPALGLSIAGFEIDTFEEAVLSVPLGLVAGLVSLHLFNAAAWLSAQVVTVFLGE